MFLHKLSFHARGEGPFEHMGREYLDIFPWSDSEGSDYPRLQPKQSTRTNDNGTNLRVSAEQPDETVGNDDADDRVDSTLVMTVIPETRTASTILWHCVKAINCLRNQCGGPALCVFKIGLTSNPLQRRAAYYKQNFKKFVIIHKVSRGELLGMLEMLEAALIAEFYDNQRCCRNRQLGGESMRDKTFMPRFAPPYFAYCVASNASQREPILA